MTDVPQQPEVPPAQQPPPQQPPAQPPSAPPPAKQDFTMGWLAHLLLLFTGFVGPLIIWLVKKDDDKYAAYHGKQAFCWALAVMAVLIGLYIIMVLLAIVAGPLAFVGMCLVWIAALGNLVYVIFGIIGASKGKPFKYFFVADKFCAKEFAEAYPDVPSAQQQTQPPAGQ